MLTKLDLKQIKKDLNDLKQEMKEDRKRDLDDLHKKISAERRKDFVELYGFLYRNFPTKDEIEPIKKDIAELKYGLNEVKDVVLQINETIQKYLPLNTSRVDKAHQRLDVVEAVVFQSA